MSPNFAGKQWNWQLSLLKVHSISMKYEFTKYIFSLTSEQCSLALIQVHYETVLQ